MSIILSVLFEMNLCQSIEVIILKILIFHISTSSCFLMQFIRVDTFTILPSRLHLCRRGKKSPTHDACPEYDTKKSDSVVYVMMELRGMRNHIWLASLPGPLWPGAVAFHWVLSVGQTELNYGWEEIVLTFKLRTYAKLNCSK